MSGLVLLHLARLAVMTIDVRLSPWMDAKVQPWTLFVLSSFE